MGKKSTDRVRLILRDIHAKNPDMDKTELYEQVSYYSRRRYFDGEDIRGYGKTAMNMRMFANLFRELMHGQLLLV